MRRTLPARRPGRGLALATVVVAALTAHTVPAARQESAEGRAVAFLRVEVPRWKREHPCYSCHNNGDATRALLAASTAGLDVGDALDDTLSWLAAPERWEQNGSRGGSNDLPLARIQFGSALSAVADARRGEATALDRAAALVITHQHEDGSWRLDASQTIGGATFYGRALATAMARRVMSRSAVPAIRQARARADAWMRVTPLVNVLDASSVLFGLGDADDAEAGVQRQRALALLRQGEATDGGWGPYVTAQPEVFDTALAVLALSQAREMPEAARRGRAFLVAQQQTDGSWVETTRPSGGESYAQRISTSAWALLALLASR